MFAVPASLDRFEACEPLLDYLKDEATRRVTPYGLVDGGPQAGFGGRLQTDLDAATTALGGSSRSSTESAAAPPAPIAEGAGGEFTTTNIQERGVDEPDIVKNDGNRLFTLVHPTDGRENSSRLVSVSMEGGNPQKLSELPIPQTYGSQLLLHDNWVIVLGSEMFQVDQLQRPEPAADLSIYPYNPTTVVAIVNVADPTNMRITETVRLDGSYVSARMIDGTSRLVLTSQPSRLPLTMPTEPIEPDRAVEHNREIIGGSSIEEWLPRFELIDDSGAKVDEGPIASCEETYSPPHFSGFGMLSVVTIDPADPQPRSSATVLGTGGTVYASAQNMYVATQRFPEVMPMVELDDASGAARPDIWPAPESSKTEIHRFDITGPTASYAGSGEVSGWVLNQWSMSEHEGFLRVATSDQRFSRNASLTDNTVWVLDTGGEELSVVATLDGLGKPGETIHGVRFIGDRGYVVTFEQIDPLHVIDLSDPRRPALLGELEIPGYSAYLHPVGPGKLLGVGQDVNDQGMPLGVQLSLFDVSDPTNPRRISATRIDNSFTPVEHDHHAFTWWAPTSRAILPVMRHGPFLARPMPEPGIEPGFAPETPEEFAAVFSVTESQVRELGRVTHQGKSDVADPWMWPGSIQRSIVVGDTLFTISGAGVMANDLATLAERGWTAF